MKKIILISLLAGLFAEYYVEDYEMIWSYDEVGKVALKLSKNGFNTSIMVCENKTGPYRYSTCLRILPSDAMKLAELLSETNLFYEKFKNEPGNMNERRKFDYGSAEGSVYFKKDLNKGFYVRLSFSSGWSNDSFEMTRKEADYISKSLKNTTPISKFLNDKLEECLE